MGGGISCTYNTDFHAMPWATVVDLTGSDDDDGPRNVSSTLGRAQQTGSASVLAAALTRAGRETCAPPAPRPTPVFHGYITTCLEGFQERRRVSALPWVLFPACIVAISIMRVSHPLQVGPRYLLAPHRTSAILCVPTILS